MLDAMHQNAALIDQQGTILLANFAWGQYTEQNEGDIAQCGPQANYLDACRGSDPDSLAVRQGIVSILADKSKKFEHFYPCHSPDQNRWFIVTVTPYLNEKDEIQALVSHSDVTQLIERQLSIEAREKHYHSIIDSLKEGIVIQAFSGNITTCNQAAETLLGISEHLMKKHQSLLPTQTIWQHNGDLFPVDQFPPTLALLTAKSVPDTILGIGNKGHPLGWLKIRSQPIFDREELQPSAIITTLIDVTEQITQNRELLELSERFELAASSANLGIWDWDITHNHLSWDDNMYQLYGVKPSDFEEANQTWIKGIHPDDARDIHRHLKDALEHGIPFEQDFRVIWPDGSVHILKPSAIVNRNLNGKPYRMVGANQDVTDLRLAQVALQQSEQRLQLMVQNLPVGAVYLEGNNIYMNSAATVITGYRHNDILTVKDWFTTLFPSSSQSEYKQYQRDHKKSFTKTRLHHFKHKDGSQRWLEFDAFLYQAGEAWIITDVTNRKEAEANLEHLAFYDPLTTLPNRSSFELTFKKLLARAKRNQQQFAIMLLDMDQFKQVNDTYGHLIGDKLLTQFAMRLQQSLPTDNTLARLGGDEFVILIEDIQSSAEVASLANFLLKELQTPYSIAQRLELTVTVSIGISIFPAHAQDTMRLLRNADTALYLAKANGRNTYSFYTERLTDDIEQRMSLEAKLRKAFKLKQFVVYYQPVMEAKSNRIVGAEALVRWQSPDGLIAPDEFIPLAEEMGLISTIGAWVLQQACEDMARWLKAGLCIQKMAVNFSPVQFERDDLVELITQTLAVSGLPAHYLDVEITENTLISNIDKVEAVVHALKDKGISISIDDFGTGYSSLAYIKRLSVNNIKIDRSFVQDIPEDKNDLQLVSTIITMGHNLNLKVIAEGIETPQQLAFFQKECCDYYQGYLVSKPVPKDIFEAMLKHS